MTMITPSYLGETIEYSSLHACRSTLEDPTITRLKAEFVPLKYKREFDKHALMSLVRPGDSTMTILPYFSFSPFSGSLSSMDTVNEWNSVVGLTRRPTTTSEAGSSSLITEDLPTPPHRPTRRTRRCGRPVLFSLLPSVETVDGADGS